MIDFNDFFWILIGRIADVLEIIGAMWVAVVLWKIAGQRLGRTADNCAERALSKAHHVNGSIPLSIGIKTAALVYTGHAPGVHIGPVAEMRID